MATGRIWGNRPGHNPFGRLALAFDGKSEPEMNDLKRRVCS